MAPTLTTTSEEGSHSQMAALALFIHRTCRRVLAPDGYFSVCVPNARQYIEAYLAGEYFRDPKTFYQPARVDTGSFIDQVNYVAYMGGEHTYLFDEENLLNTFYKAGYSKVTLREFDANIDIPERHLGSIYANALP
jgi:predicted SAM-dependent methyltransferase